MTLIRHGIQRRGKSEGGKTADQTEVICAKVFQLHRVRKKKKVGSHLHTCKRKKWGAKETDRVRELTNIKGLEPPNEKRLLRRARLSA